MAELPFPVQGQNIELLLKLMEDLYQERIGGALIGDVFDIGDDDILTITIGDGLEKVASALSVLLAAAGGLQFSSGAISIKLKVGGGLAVTVDGLEVTGIPLVAFKTIDCPAGTDPVADTATDTLTFTAGTGITITGDSATDTVTIATTGVELLTSKDGASGYAGLNAASRTVKGADTTDDLIVDLATKGLIIKDAAAPPHYWRLGISVLGVLITTDLGTVKP